MFWKRSAGEVLWLTENWKHFIERKRAFKPVADSV